MAGLKRSRSGVLAAGLCLAAVSLSTVSWAAARSQSGAEHANRTAIANGFRRWASGTGSPYELLAADAVWTIAGNSAASKRYPDREAFLSGVIRPFNARMKSGLKPEIHGIYADGDTVVVHFDAAGIAKDGKPYRNSYAWILRMQDGRIIEATAFFDAIAFDDLWGRVQP